MQCHEALNNIMLRISREVAGKTWQEIDSSIREQHFRAALENFLGVSDLRLPSNF